MDMVQESVVSNMSKAFVILAMIFCHILDDFVLQPVILSKLKQKSFWEKEAPEKIYEKDYIMALIMHAASWAFLMMLPIAIFFSFNVSIEYIVMFLLNTIIHAVIDNEKANHHRLNLIQDQMMHLIQIGLTVIVLLSGVI